MDKESLRKELLELENKERDLISSFRKEFESLRERICIAHGGHFFCEPVEKTIEMLFGYIVDKVEICEVCRYEKRTEIKRVL